MVKGKTAKSKKSEREGSDCLLPRPSECVRIRGVEIKDNSDKDQLFRALRGKGKRIGKVSMENCFVRALPRFIL